MAARRKVKQAFIKPASTYGEPAAVLADDGLGDAEKRRVLENWERDAREREAAGDDTARLGEVIAALSALPPENERPCGPETTDGSRPIPSSRPQASAGTRLSAGEARQGEIILKTPLRRAIFIGGLVLAAVVCVLLFYWAAL